MSEKYSKFDSQVKTFNETFKVNFNYDNFENRIKKLDSITRSLMVRNKIGSDNMTYRSTLLNLYHQTILNYVEGKIDDINHADLVNGFEKLMENYRSVNPTKHPALYGNWKHTADLIGALREVANKMSNDKADYIKDKYLAGKYPLRQMREELNTVRANGQDATAAQLSKVMLMSRALEKTVNGRSFVWRMFHPFRNKAEKRDLKALMAYLDTDIVKKNANFTLAEEMANDKPITLANAKLDLSLKKHQEKKENMAKDKEGVAKDNQNGNVINNNVINEDTNVIDNVVSSVDKPIESNQNISVVIDDNNDDKTKSEFLNESDKLDDRVKQISN